MFNKLRQKLQQLFIPQYQLANLQKIAALEERLHTIEKAHIIILNKFIESTKQALSKRDQHSEVVMTTSKDVNADKNPTYH